MAVKYIPDGYHTVTPYLIVEQVSDLIEFLKKAFNAKEVLRMPGPDGRIAHAEVQIGDSMVMMGSASEKYKPLSAGILLYVEDVDAVHHKALAAGAISLMEPEDMFYGDRTSGVKDEFGNSWWISTHIEDVSPEEINRRMSEMVKARG